MHIIGSFDAAGNCNGLEDFYRYWTDHNGPYVIAVLSGTHGVEEQGSLPVCAFRRRTEFRKAFEFCPFTVIVGATELGTSRESYAGLFSKLPGIGPCKRENPAERSQDQSYHEAAHASQDAYDREGEG